MSWLDRLRGWFAGVEPDPALAPKLLAVARATAEARGWPWEEPIDLRPDVPVAGQGTWAVRTNVHSMGMNVLVIIREADLVVLHAGYLPR